MSSYSHEALATIVAGFDMPFGGSTVVRSTCPQFDRGLEEKSVRNRHSAGTANLEATAGNNAWRPPDW
jgi:hypothetical protein